jgi:glutamine---fructose-6-phosphate transaminase (isomerizing)
VAERTTWKDFLDQSAALTGVISATFGSGRDALDQARNLLLSRRQIIVSGMGASHHAGLAFAQCLQAHGHYARCIEAGELLHGHAAIPADAVLVLVSRSGESVEVTRLLDKIGDTAKVIGVTNVTTSTLARRATVPLLMHAPADKIVAQQSYLATVAVLLALAGALVPALASEAGFEWASQAVADTVAALPEATITQGRLWARARPLYIFGRREAFASAVEGQLLVHEVAQFPAVAMTGHAFRHGPFEVVDEEFNAVIITAAPPMHDLDLALARDIRERGGQAWLTGPGLDVPTAPVAPVFAPLVDVLALQMVAIRIAEARGLVPGTFRWSSLVTLREDGFSI